MSIALKVDTCYDLECDAPGCPATLAVSWEWGGRDDLRMIIESGVKGWHVAFSELVNSDSIKSLTLSDAFCCFCPEHGESKP